jgi:molybdenum cofactor synthesis domain-containing protein
LTTNIGILVIGNEILDGLVLDTNSQWIINQLKALNFHVIQKTTVRDEIPVIGRALRRLVSNGCNLIFTTGGLGPTHDDKTLLGVANAFDLPMGVNDQALEIVTRQYTDLHQRGVIEHAKMTAPRRKMAILPKGAKPLDNRVGGAPGVILDIEGAQIICLPGVPGELMWIFDNQVLQLLKSKVEGRHEGHPGGLHQVDGEALRRVRHKALDLSGGPVPGGGGGEGEQGRQPPGEALRGSAHQRIDYNY